MPEKLQQITAAAAERVPENALAMLLQQTLSTYPYLTHIATTTGDRGTTQATQSRSTPQRARRDNIGTAARGLPWLGRRRAVSDQIGRILLKRSHRIDPREIRRCIWRAAKTARQLQRQM